jgi:hypothetical protein
VTDPKQLVNVRMDIAWAQFEQLRDAFIALSEEWNSHPDPEPQPGGVTYLYRANVTEVDLVLRVQTGAFVHQVRSTLDNIAWTFAVTVKPEPGRVSFPICRSRAEFDRASWTRLLGPSAQCVSIAESFQPYNRPEGRCLLALHALWNLDKHRAPSVLPVIPTHVRLFRKAKSPRPVSTKLYLPRGGKPVENGRVLARVVMPSTSDAPPLGGAVLRPALDSRRLPPSERILPNALCEMFRYVRYDMMPPLLRLL